MKKAVVEARAHLSPNAWLRYDLLRELLLRQTAASSFLEIGCGMGGLAALLVDRYEYVGYEPDSRSCDVAVRRVAGRGRIVNEPLPAVPSRMFDIVGAFEVLEHIEDDRAALALWHQWITPGGTLLLSVPATPSRFSAADVAVGHYRRYDRSGLRSLLSEIGLNDVEIWAYGFPLGYMLEFARNRLARQHTDQDLRQRTAASGRFFQPPACLATWTRLGTAPFRLMQRPFRRTSWGTGLIAVARRPA